MQHLVLQTIAAAGVLSVALLAPNVLGAMVKLGIVPRKRSKESVASARRRLINQGLLVNSNGEMKLTKKGERALSKYSISSPKKVKRWDKRWRVLVFDIPEKKHQLRTYVRRSLQQYGFVLLQKSVWVYPHNCENFIALLKTELRVGKEMIYMIVESIENDTQLKKKFNLS